MIRLHRVNFILLTLVFLLMDNPASANGWTEIKELGKGKQFIGMLGVVE